MKSSAAHDAYWFIYNHPSFILHDRVHIPRKKKPSKDTRITKDLGGNYWEEYLQSTRHAMELNLSIFYTKVNKSGVVSDKKESNKYPECWLELGTMKYGYFGEPENGDKSELVMYHDIRLDSGGRTFDDALVNMAAKVLKFYGDYPKKND